MLLAFNFIISVVRWCVFVLTGEHDRFFSFNKEVSLLVNLFQSWVLEVLTMLSFRYETLYGVEPRSLVL